MSLEKEPFRNYALEEEKEETTFQIVSVKMNTEEYLKLQERKKLIRQPKDSTAIKFLMDLGAEVILEPKSKLILDTAFKNERNNRRTGRTQF